MSSYDVSSELDNTGICASRDSVYMFRGTHLKRLVGDEVVEITKLPVEGSWWGPTGSKCVNKMLYVLRSDYSLYCYNLETQLFTKIDYQDYEQTK